MKVSVAFNDWAQQEDDNFELELSSSKVETISCSYDGGRFSLEINGEDVFKTGTASHDASIEVSIIGD